MLLLSFLLSVEKAGLPLNPVFLSCFPHPVLSLPQLLWILMEEFTFGTGRAASCLGALRRPRNQFSLRARTSWRFRIYRKTGITLVCEPDKINVLYLSKMLHFFKAFLRTAPNLIFVTAPCGGHRGQATESAQSQDTVPTSRFRGLHLGYLTYSPKITAEILGWEETFS